MMRTYFILYRTLVNSANFLSYWERTTYQHSVNEHIHSHLTKLDDEVNNNNQAFFNEICL